MNDGEIQWVVGVALGLGIFGILAIVFFLFRNSHHVYRYQPVMSRPVIALSTL